MTTRLIHLHGKTLIELKVKCDQYEADNTDSLINWNMPNYDTLKDKWTCQGIVQDVEPA